MKEKIFPIIKFIFNNFGPLVVFYFANHFYGLKPAIVASTIFSFAEIGLKIYLKQPITAIFKFTAVITLVFGMVDLYAQQSFLFKYESTVTNIFTGIFFGYSLFADKTVVQEFYEKRKNAKPMTRDRVAYFRILTGVWVFYFFSKAGAYYWVARNYDLEQGMLIRTVLGSASFYVLLFISIFGSKRIFPILKKYKLLPSNESA